jgi:polyhydroxyalkanoate synthesis regulator phasin
MVSLEELLTPSNIGIVLILSLIVMLFQYFRQAMDGLKDTTNKDLQIINKNLERLELEIRYKEELNKVKKDIDELRRGLSELQKERRI